MRSWTKCTTVCWQQEPTTDAVCEVVSEGWTKTQTSHPECGYSFRSRFYSAYAYNVEVQ